MSPGLLPYLPYYAGWYKAADMKGMSFRAAQAGDGRALASVLRPEDRQELLASHPREHVAQLLESFIAYSQSSVCLLRGKEVVALAGIYAPVALGLQARVWLLTGRKIGLSKFSFFRLAKQQLARWLARYPVLSNEVDVRYPAALHLLTHLNACFDGKVSVYSQINFLHFLFRRNIWEEL